VLCVLIVAILVLGGLVSGGTFLSSFNLQSMATQVPEIGLLAIGVMLAMCAGNGGIDLSGIANANMSSVASGIFTLTLFDPYQNPMSFTVIFAIGCMIVGLLSGVLNGIIISRFSITPILATLGTQMLFTGFAVVLSGGRSVTVGAPDPLYELGNGLFLGAPISFLIFILIGIILGIVLKFTPYGMRLMLTGSNPKAAIYSGFPIERIIITTYAISGLLAGIAGIIIAGLMVWNKITAMPENAQVIEIYAKQFDWTVRYSGEDNTLGNSNFKVIETNNPLGVVTSDLIDAKELVWKADLAKLEKTIVDEGDLTPDEKLSEMKFKVERLKRQLIRLAPLRKVQTPQTDSAENDDVIVKELYLVKGQVYEFKLRSRDVIHSALFPHFRAQMNCVPGMTTRLSFKPIISTAEMRKNPDVIAQYKKTNKKRVALGKEEVDFNYLLLCNKVCGGSHYNMQMNIVVVDTQAEFDIWYAKQKESKTFAQLAGLVKPVEEIVETVDSTMNEVIVIQ